MRKGCLLEGPRQENNFPLLFDEQFEVLDFNASFDIAESASGSVLSTIRDIVSKVSPAMQEDLNYVVDMSDELKDSISAGDIALVTSKDGEIYAQLRNANGRFGKPLPIKKDLADEGVTFEAVQVALQMDSIKVQLKAIIDTMKAIECRVVDIIKGQRNDRIGLFYSGVSLYVEARSINDELLKKQITAQALKSLSDACSQMIQEIQSSVDYLVTE